MVTVGAFNNNHMKQKLIVLASASPRRSELLNQIGVQADILPMDIDERVLPAESPRDYVVRLSKQKALAALDLRHDAVVVGADTIVVVDQQVLGKPRDQADHARMFALLSGRTHDVFTAVTIADSTQVHSALSHSQVTFAEVGAQEVAAYWRSGEPADKAGGYAIQGKGALFITNLDGSFSSVMGLPLETTGRLLAKFELDLWANATE